MGVREVIQEWKERELPSVKPRDVKINHLISRKIFRLFASLLFPLFCKTFEYVRNFSQLI